MANALISRPSYNRIATATITVDSGTEDADYPISPGVKNTEPGKWGKFTTNTGSFVMDFGGAVAIPIFGMPLYFISAGATVALQANSSVSWGSPPLNVAITIPTHRQNGFAPGVLVDLSAITHTYRYWRLTVTAGNAQPIQVGWLWPLSTREVLIQNVRWEVKEVDTKPQIVHETEFLWETIYPFGTARKAYTAEIRMHQNDGAEEQYADWHDAAGESEFFLFSLDPDGGRATLVRHSAPNEITRAYNDKITPVNLLQRSLGLRP